MKTISPQRKAFTAENCKNGTGKITTARARPIPKDQRSELLKPGSERSEGPGKPSPKLFPKASRDETRNASGKNMGAKIFL